MVRDVVGGVAMDQVTQGPDSQSQPQSPFVARFCNTLFTALRCDSPIVKVLYTENWKNINIMP